MAILTKNVTRSVLPTASASAASTRSVLPYCCRNPPEGIRDFGLRRPSNYGQFGVPKFCKAANEAVLVHVKIEHADQWLQMGSDFSSMLRAAASSAQTVPAQARRSGEAP